MFSGSIQPVHETYDAIYLDNKKNALDHLMVTLTVEIPRKTSSKACARSRASYNRAAVSCPQGIARITHALEQILCLAFNLEPSTHLNLVQQYFREAAALAFPVQQSLVGCLL